MILCIFYQILFQNLAEQRELNPNIINKGREAIAQLNRPLDDFLYQVL